MTKQTDYGIVVLTHFANKSSNLTLTARDISAEAGIPLPMVSKILKLLSRKGILISHRGVKGGYSLSRRADQITVAEVISALEGPIGMTECSSHEEEGECNMESHCPVRFHWQAISYTVKRALEELTLSQMIGPVPQPIVNFGRQM